MIPPPLSLPFLSSFLFISHLFSLFLFPFYFIPKVLLKAPYQTILPAYRFETIASTSSAELLTIPCFPA